MTALDFRRTDCDLFGNPAVVWPWREGGSSRNEIDCETAQPQPHSVKTEVNLQGSISTTGLSDPQQCSFYWIKPPPTQNKRQDPLECQQHHWQLWEEGGIMWLCFSTLLIPVWTSFVSWICAVLLNRLISIIMLQTFSWKRSSGGSRERTRLISCVYSTHGRKTGSPQRGLSVCSETLTAANSGSSIHIYIEDQGRNLVVFCISDDGKK